MAYGRNQGENDMKDDIDFSIIKDFDPGATLAAYAAALADDLESRDENVLGPTDSRLAVMALRRLASSV